MLLTQGVNGTLAGTEEAVTAYISMMCAHPAFQMTEADFKHSWAGDVEEPFPDLFIKVHMSRHYLAIL